MSRFPFDVVAFDLDGTLADTAPDLAASLNHAIGAIGRPAVPVEAVRDMIGHGVRAMLRKGLAATGDASEALVERCAPLLLEHYTAHLCVDTRPYAELDTALDALAAMGVKLAVCTNKPEALAARLIAALGWADRFAALVGGDTLPERKPDAAPLHEAVRRAGGGRAVYVGDSIVDADTARAAGLPYVAVSFGFSDRPIAELGADAVIDSYAELVPALETLGQLAG